MCGGEYLRWGRPRQLTRVRGEPIVARIIRLLRECGVEDIAISSGSDQFDQFGVPVLKHDNGYVEKGGRISGQWCDAFYPMEEPACYIFGDVVFSPEAIRTIVETETEDIEFFGSRPPFAETYVKRWAEPFALKVARQDHLQEGIRTVTRLDAEGRFARKPIMWELWAVLTGRDINSIDFGSYVAINDYTCDIDEPVDAVRIERQMT